MAAPQMPFAGVEQVEASWEAGGAEIVQVWSAGSEGPQVSPLTTQVSGDGLARVRRLRRQLLPKGLYVLGVTLLPPQDTPEPPLPRSQP